MTEFDPLAVSGGKMAAAGDDTPASASAGSLKAASSPSRDTATNIAADQLRAFIERIERLEEEKASIAADIKDVYGEAKATGFDTKVMKIIISIRKKGIDEFNEAQAILDTYLAALGMIEGDGE